MPITRSHKIALIISGLLLTLLLIGVALFALIYLAFRDSEPTIDNNSVLVLQVKGALPDYAPQDPIASRFFGASDLSLTELLLQFKKAKADTRIRAILLEIDGSGAG